jgi:CheY-like chemotaxis protein
MIVEDEGIVASDIGKALEDLGYQVAGVATSGEEALRKVAEENPDLVLMDIMLEGQIDGIEAADRIHKILDIPVLYLTAHAGEDLLERAKSTGPHGYILKPVDDLQLKAAIEMAICKHKADKDLKDRGKALLQMERGCKTFLEGIPDLMFRLNKDGVFIDFRVPGNFYPAIPLSEFLSKTMYRLMEAPDLKRSIELALLTGKTQPLEYRLELGDEERIFEVRINRCADDEVLAVIRDITESKNKEQYREKSIRDLEGKLYEAKKLNGILPICASCKKVRNPGGSWETVESYIQKHSGIRFSHSICPECRNKLNLED